MRKTIFCGFHNFLRQFMKGAELLILASIFSTFTACQNTQTIQKQIINQEKNPTKPQQITDGFYELLSDEPVKLNVALKEISHSAKSKTFPNAAIEKYTGSRRKYINEELNSRLPISLNSGDWKIKWQTDLPSSFTPSAILEINDRIVIESDGIWFLFDQNGKKLLNGSLGASGIILDGENFYAADSNGLIFARRLSDGADVFGLSLYFGNAYARTFMLHKGQKFLAVSTERELDPHKSDTIENSLIELIDLGNPLKTDRDGLLKSLKPLAHLVRKTKFILTASHNETYVFATQNRVYSADSNLNIIQALKGDFTPLTISLDDLGRIYLIVKQKNNYFLWLLLPTGELAMTFELPASFKQTSTPPIVGFNYNIYLLGENGILAVNSEGKQLWQTSSGKKNSGAIITANDQLLVSAENELLAFGAKGQKRVVIALADEIISASPILTAKGEIIIASKKSLYCLISSANN